MRRSRNFIVSVDLDPISKLIVTPGPAVILLGDTIQWLSNAGENEGSIDDPDDEKPFTGVQPWIGKKDNASNQLKAVKKGRFKYKVKVKLDDGTEPEIDPEVIVT